MTSRGWAALILIATVGNIADGQRLDRAVRPAVTAAAPFRMPAVHSQTLKNGLRVMVVEDHGVPVVSVRTVFAVDSTDDPVGKEGLFALTLGTLREGTTTQSAEKIAQGAAAIGTPVSPSAFTTTTRSFAAALSILGGMLMHPALDSAGIERRRALQIAAIRRTAQSPFSPARRLFYSALFGPTHAVTRSYFPSEASVAGLTAADVRAFYGRAFGPAATTIVVAGDVTVADAVKAVETVFAKWNAGTSADRGEPEAAPPARATSIFLFDVPGTTSYMYVGKLGPARSAADSYAAEVMGTISGTRLQQELRDKLALIYSGTSGIIWRPVPNPSVFVGSTSVSATKADSALSAWIRLLKGLRAEKPVTAPELDAARRRLVGQMPAKIDGADSLSARVAELVRDRVGLNALEEYATGVGATSAGAVAAAASRYLDLEHLVIVVTGDRTVLEPALRAANIAPIVVVDARGNPLR